MEKKLPLQGAFAKQKVKPSYDPNLGKAPEVSFR